MISTCRVLSISKVIHRNCRICNTTAKSNKKQARYRATLAYIMSCDSLTGVQGHQRSLDGLLNRQARLKNISLSSSLLFLKSYSTCCKRFTNNTSKYVSIPTRQCFSLDSRQAIRKNCVKYFMIDHQTKQEDNGPLSADRNRSLQIQNSCQTIVTQCYSSSTDSLAMLFVKLWHVQNAAATHLIFVCKLAWPLYTTCQIQLHWLPIRWQSQYKLCLMMSQLSQWQKSSNLPPPGIIYPHRGCSTPKIFRTPPR